VLWSGRFSKSLNKKILDFTSSYDLDKRLYKYDILGSIAHAQSLKDINVLSVKEIETIIKGLKKIELEFDKNIFKISGNDEDIHMAIERRLIELIGNVGKKLHTGRSRNDQVSLDMRMYLKDEIKNIIKYINVLINSLKKTAEKNIDVIMPGYTHLQQAQPVRLAHHLLAYVQMFKRDEIRFESSYKSCDVSPLGSGALSGTPYAVNRGKTAKKLNFNTITENSMDAVSDRDFILDFLYASSVFAMHCSRLCEDFIIWSSQEFGFIELDDAYTTGSSLMPNKKNPDVLELMRGKSERAIGGLNSFFNVMKALPLTYNRDMQEDKYYLFTTIDLINNFLDILPSVVETTKINTDTIKISIEKSYIYATKIADYLVSKSMPFREAHKVTGELVGYAIKNKKYFKDLKIEEYKKFSNLFEKDIYNQFDAEKIVDSQKTYGSTSIKSVREQLKNK
jgi:argininosuccinate lyase